MANTPLQVELSEEFLDHLRQLAREKNLSLNELVLEALEAYAHNSEQTAVEEGWRDIDNGNFVEHEEMLRRLEKLRLKASAAA